MLSQSTRRAPETSLAQPNYQFWQHPARTAGIYVHRHVINTLSPKAVHFLRDDREIGGILWGKPGPGGSLIICDVTLVPASATRFNTTALDIRAIDEALHGHVSDPTLGVVGYFRSHVRDGLFLSPQDRALIDQYFPEPDSVFLILKPFDAGICTAGFFIRTGNSLPDESELEVPFVITDEDPEVASPAATLDPAGLYVADLLRESTLHHGQVSSTPTASKPSASRPAGPILVRNHVAEIPHPEEAAQRKDQHDLDLPPLLVPALLLALVCSGGALLYMEWSALHSLPTVASKPLETGINLKVDRAADGQLTLTWNKNAPQFENALDGTLFVKDGRRSPKLPLDLDQLRSGTLLYSPKTSDVSFRLELNLPGGRTVEESLRLEPEAYSAVNRKAEARNATPERTPQEEQRVTALAVPPNHSPESQLRTLSLSSGAPTLIPGHEVLPGPGIPSPGPPVNGAYTGPQVVQEMMPQSSPVGHSVQLSVWVAIDETGRVTDARLLDDANTVGALARPALEAARHWYFQPATVNRKPVRSEYTIVFAFRPQLPVMANGNSVP